MRSKHDAAVTGNGKTAFLFALLTFLLDNLRISHDDKLLGIVAYGDIDDHQPDIQPDLRRRQSNPGGGVHGLHHVICELGEIVWELG